MASITIKMSPCDITTLKADVCVSSVHRSKEMKKGILASHVKARCGEQVQKELHQISKGQELGHGEVVMTSAGNLNSNFAQLMFVCLYCWRIGNDEALTAAVKKCLEVATAKGFRSIAFPALGMGGQSYPPFNVAKGIVTAIVQFIQSHPDTSLTTVHIALQDKDINSTRTFLQTTIAVLAGVDLGREMNKDGHIGFEGVQSFDGLQSTKPKLAKLTAQELSIRPDNIQPPTPFGRGFSKTYKNLTFNVQPQGSLSNWTIGARAEVNLDLSGYVPSCVKSVMNYIVN